MLLLQQFRLWQNGSREQALRGRQVRVRRPGSALIVVTLRSAESEIKNVVRTSGSGWGQRAHDRVVGAVHEEAVAPELAPQRVVPLFGVTSRV